MAIDLDRLVEAEKGLVSRKLFVDDEIYEWEMERIFARCWLYLGHETQIPKRGDYLTTYMGEDPIIVWRDQHGKIGAFLNSCRHRGMKVCRLEEGNANFFSCPYHGWTYNSEGKLVTVPEYKEGYHEELNREEWGLVPVSRVGTYKGLIFGTFEESGESLEEYLGDMRWYLDLMVDCTDEGLEIVPGTHKWTIPANWKFAADNFVGDSYHVPRTHSSAFELNLFPEHPDVGPQVSPGKGHGLGINVFKLPGGRAKAVNIYPPEILPYVHYLRAHREETARRLGPERDQILQSLLAANGTVFPNFSFLYLPGYLTFRVWHPKGPGKMEVWAWSVVEKGMPKEFKEMASRAYLNQFGPGGIFEQDDAEMWPLCGETAIGRVSRRYALNYQMGLGREERREEMPGRVAKVLSELNQRNFYQRWLEIMKREPLHAR